MKMAIGYSGPARRRMDARRVYTNTRFCSKHALATSHTWLRTSRYIPSLPDVVRGLGGGRAKIPCPATSNVPGLSCKGSWLEGRSGVAGSGWVKWPQLDLQCQPEFFFFFLLVC